MFRVGDKVVCVDDAWRHDDPGVLAVAISAGMPERRKTYTVAGYDTRTLCPGTRADCGFIFLEEIGRAGSTNVSFAEDHFRPVVSRPTSIEIFTKLLTPARERVGDLCGNSD